MLLDAVASGRGSDFPAKSVTKMYGSTLLALRRGWVGGCRISSKKNVSYVTFEWPLTRGFDGNLGRLRRQL